VTIQKSHRAGRYLKQATGYSAFVPSPLPPTPTIAFDDDLQTILSKADRCLGRLDGSIQTLPDPDLFVFMYVRKEAVLSSQIEGTQSSLSDLLEAEAHVLDPSHPRDVGEVLNYVRAMNFGLQRLEKLPLSLRLINEIHEQLMHNVRGQERSPGEVRRSQNWIGPEGCNLHSATFVPPPPHEIMSALGDLERFIHAHADLPALVKIGLIHAQFETIHPYLDGNGRIGRLLITFLLCKDEILTQPVLYLSHYFKRHRQAYYDRLQRIRDHGEWEEWLRFFLKGVIEVSQEATQTARAIVQLREDHRDLVTRKFGRGAASGLTVLENLFERPVITVRVVRDMLDVTNQAANKLVNRFVENGILQEITGQERYRVFRYAPYVALFARDDRVPVSSE